ncbi:BTB/POZ domain-containing protein 6-B-like [Liolophura sinensis]|uniref:BTB/POZ domain-containing protein 6-B-like n=1 Tax=Liolophura sinensis TaxID=3198878 RepID=UPI003158254B
MMSGLNPEVPLDWQLNKSLLECTSQLFLSSHLSDITFIFPNEHPIVNIPAHKFILGIRSPVFETMFCGALPAGETVKIIDNTSSAFKAMIKFMYTDRSEFNSSSEAIETMQAAHKYRIPLLAEICASYMENSVTTENVCCILDQAFLYDLTRLQTRCRKFIDENASQVFRTEGFTMLTPSTLGLILESDDLRLDECEVYQAAVVWAGSECSRQELRVTGENKRKVLGDAFYQLRFPHIPLQTFSEVVSREGLLTNEEVIDLFRYHASETKKPVEFCNNARRSLPSVMISRMQDGFRRNNMSKGCRTEAIKFQVTFTKKREQVQQARLVSLGLLNAVIRCDMEDEYFANSHLVTIELEYLSMNTESDSDDDFFDRPSKDLAVSSFCFPFTSKETKCITVDLPKPVDLTDGRWYKLSVTIYSSHKTMLKGKQYIQLLGSAIKSKVILESGLKVGFQGSTHGPIHSIYLRTD